MRRLQPSEVLPLMEWIADRHYLEGTPAGCVFALEFLDRRQRIGAMLLGTPAAPGLDDAILQLSRMYFIDGTEHCIESQALAMMRKFIRTWYPRIRLLLSYSDPEQGHEGTIYAADGWAKFGMTRSGGKGWNSRHCRKSSQGWPKQRWVRT